MRNQIYIGVRLYDSKRSTERRIGQDGRQTDRKKVARAESEIIRVQVIEEPLIDPAEFWRVQDILSRKRQGFTERRRDSDVLFLLKGMLRCEVCGEPLYTVPGGKAGAQKDYYYCRRKSSYFRGSTGGCPANFMKRVVVEDTVMEFISQRLADKDYILDHVSKLFAGGAEARAAQEQSEVRALLTRLEKTRKRSLELYTDGVLEREELDAKLLQVARERTRLEAKLSALSEPGNVTQADLCDIAERTARGFALFPFWPHEDQRRYLRFESPEFWIGAAGVSQFSLPVGLKLAERLGRGSWPPRA
ncbi:MAG: recombinase zinc beta ribbon domain-containing protein [Humidesulfovibrio sp.]|nr:recombinase zinc beta ribbon domain-containing protein [Humidesulfovibrio sp.]